MCYWFFIFGIWEVSIFYWYYQVIVYLAIPIVSTFKQVEVITVLLDEIGIWFVIVG